jgi:hypothetical protein
MLYHAVSHLRCYEQSHLQWLILHSIHIFKNRIQLQIDDACAGLYAPNAFHSGFSDASGVSQCWCCAATCTLFYDAGVTTYASGPDPPAPTPAPTPGPTPRPTPAPTPGPTEAPTSAIIPAPTAVSFLYVREECAYVERSW